MASAKVLPQCTSLAKLSRPLDFIVIADHAEMYGLMPQLLIGDPDILATEQGRRWYDLIMTGNRD